MNIDISLKVGKKGMRLKFDDEDNNNLLACYLQHLIKNFKKLQNAKYINNKLLAYRTENETKKLLPDERL